MKTISQGGLLVGERVWLEVGSIVCLVVGDDVGDVVVEGEKVDALLMSTTCR